MANPNKYFSSNNVCDIIEIFEDFLKTYDVRIPESDSEMIKDEGKHALEENETRIYGTVFGDLFYDLIGYFEKLEKLGTIPNVVNSYDAEIEIWDEEEKGEN